MTVPTSALEFLVAALKESVASLFEVVTSDKVDCQETSGAVYAFCNVSTWRPVHYAIFFTVTLIVFRSIELAQKALIAITKPPLIPDVIVKKVTFQPWDYLMVILNDLFLIVINYHAYRFIGLSSGSQIVRGLNTMNVLNTLGATVMAFLIYDFILYFFHRFILHNRYLYKYIHKQHHSQIAASNFNELTHNQTNTLEFCMHGYNMFLSLYLISRYLFPVHWSCVLLLVAGAGTLSIFNHMPYDISIPHIFEVRNHYMHHIDISVNHGQYLMVWDRLFGTYKPYRPKTVVLSPSKPPSSCPQ